MAYESDDPNTTTLCLRVPVKGGVSRTKTRRTTPREDRCPTPDNDIDTTPDDVGADSQDNEILKYADNDEDIDIDLSIPCGQKCK